MVLKPLLPSREGCTHRSPQHLDTPLSESQRQGGHPLWARQFIRALRTALSLRGAVAARPWHCMNSPLSVQMDAEVSESHKHQKNLLWRKLLFFPPLEHFC